MHDDAWWCMMMHDDAWWCMMIDDDAWSIHDDAWWYMMMLDDAWWCRMMHDDAWWCLMHTWWCMMVYDDTWWCMIDAWWMHDDACLNWQKKRGLRVTTQIIARGDGNLKNQCFSSISLLNANTLKLMIIRLTHTNPKKTQWIQIKTVCAFENN